MELARPWWFAPSAGIAFCSASLVAFLGCSSKTPAPTEASVAAMIAEGSSGLCNNNVDQPFLPTLSNGGVTSLIANGDTVADPANSTTRTARVTCKVLHNADGTYSFTGSASLSLSWSFGVSGSNLTASPGTAGSATVSASFTPAGLNTNPIVFTGNDDCTFSWPANLGFIAGGVAGTLSCPDVVAGQGAFIQSDGGWVPYECVGSATFAFEGCATD